MRTDDAIRQVSKELNIPYEVCRKAYMSAWKFIYRNAETPVLSIDTPVEEFRRCRMNFNIPSLGKLNITEDKFNKINRKFRYTLELRKRNAENKEH